MALPGQWETNAAVNRSLFDMVKYGLPEDYYQQYDAQVRNLSLEEVLEAKSGETRGGKVVYSLKLKF